MLAWLGAQHTRLALGGSSVRRDWHRRWAHLCEDLRTTLVQERQQ
jgi:hypothetical protein